MSLHTDIRNQIKDAMKAKDAVRLTTLRGLVTDFTNELVAKKRTPQEELADDEALEVVRRAGKRRRDSIEQYEKGGRPELAESERAELAIIETYLPQMMSREEIRPVVERKVAELGITDKTGMGKLMGAVMQELKGRADGGDVKALIEEVLA